MEIANFRDCFFEIEATQMESLNELRILKDNIGARSIESKRSLPKKD